MPKTRTSRRSFLKGAGALMLASGTPFANRASAQTLAPEEQRILDAARRAGSGELRAMIWSNYFVPMQPSMEEFRRHTNITVGSIQDISIFDAPQRAMAEALSRSPQFDIFHVDSNMIPSLVSAGLLEPLDEYMRAANFSIDAVGHYGRFMTYRNQTYGVPTDGNVHVQYMRRDLFENPDNQKRFSDRFGRALTWPETWEQQQQLMDFFHNPDGGIWGSCNLRNRANGATWWYQMFYSAGGFPFDDDMNPTLATPAGEYAVDMYLAEKSAAHPESPGWGTPQMIPRIVQGNAAMCQYWDGIIKNNENRQRSPTAGRWLYGLVPGSDLSGKRLHRSISSPLGAVMVNRHSPRKAQAAYLCLWWGTNRASTQIVSDNVNTFHDAWAKAHMTAPSVVEAYTPGGIRAIEQNLQVACPPIYLTGYLEFQDILAKNLSEAYTGQLPARQVTRRTQEEWAAVIRRIGRPRLREELASYKAVFPTIDRPA